jgi:hypothetical protein
MKQPMPSCTALHMVRIAAVFGRVCTSTAKGLGVRVVDSCSFCQASMIIKRCYPQTYPSPHNYPAQLTTTSLGDQTTYQTYHGNMIYKCKSCSLHLCKQPKQHLIPTQLLQPIPTSIICHSSFCCASPPMEPSGCSPHALQHTWTAWPTA